MAPRRLALVTGASAGIGAALARVYAAHGWDLALTARRADRLAQLADEIRTGFGVDALVLPDDLADPGAPQRLLAALEGGGRTVDALVNNAGFSRTTGFAATPAAEHQAMLQVMLNGPVELTRRALPGMHARGYGRILNVASVAGLLPATGGDTLYGPVKSFLVKASRGLWLETRGTGVHVTALCPGYTFSEFHDVNGSRAEVSAAIPRWMWMSAEAVARAGYEAAEANRAVCVPGLANKALVALMQVLPDDWTLRLVARHGERLKRL